MKHFARALVIATSLVVVGAVNVNGDPTDLSNYPACAQICIPPGLEPPTGCGSLSNITCVCETPSLTDAVTACELTTCSKAEVSQVNALGAALCPNGIDFILSEVENALASTQYLIPATPTYAPSITGLVQASAVLATATPAPNLGNPTNAQSYPPCVQKCLNQTSSIVNDKNSLAEICGLEHRTQMAVCETAICSNYDRQAGQLLAQQLCTPFYNTNNNASLASSISAAIASANPIARAAAAGKNAMDISNYPACAQNCQISTSFHGCTSLSNTPCLCPMFPAAWQPGSCEAGACSMEDTIGFNALAYKLCGGIGSVINGSNGFNQTNGSATGSPSPVAPFTGGAAGFVGKAGAGVVGGVLVVVVVVGVFL